jgi:hypothetical protein
MIDGRPMLEGCGNYQVYAQIDGERPKHRGYGIVFENGTTSMTAKLGHFLPQHFNLEQLHADYPNATYVLPLREPQVWAYSVMQWFHMKRWIINEYMSHNSSILDPTVGDARREFLARIYDEHNNHVRRFVTAHPTHALIEVNITDPWAGVKLAEAFHLDSNCWGHKNKLEEHAKIKDVKLDLLTKGKTDGTTTQ